MGNDKGPLSWIKKQLTKSEDSQEKKTSKYPYLLIAVVFGVAVMLVGNLFTSNGTDSEGIPTFSSSTEQEDEPAFGQKKTAENNMIADYEAEYENELKEALEAIAGVEDVTVVVNVDATEKKVLEKNTVTQSQTTEETDREGGKRGVEDLSKDEQLVIIREGEKETPIVIETKKPAIRGVLVVAKGAENVQVQKWITEAVTRTLEVPSHRVSVLPKKSKGDS
ncbi:stage III sporulation protein AG [Mesobacillus maritimus]|uniref:stage III sporulation protein AG n=1 Tax=Mesobacillus maritimus TaxID=1643336 RepID=UPI0020418BA4|nr:stage III sporulation protein AG [Mesobacillus maritimus]MCM3586378.1 stage III sporulation protein AG [Mesobacillus maritimus]MCM3669590.1 stage III sporulation protein AG [Mesobacillus maritimus]